MASPFLVSFASAGANLKLMGNSLNLKHPFLSADTGLNDLILNIVCSVIISIAASAAELGEIFDIIITLISLALEHVRNICIAIHVVSHVIITIVNVATTRLVLDHWLLELELVLQDNLGKSLQEDAYTISMPSLELACRHIELYVHFLELQDHVLRGGRRVVILIPPRHLLAIQLEEP